MKKLLLALAIVGMIRGNASAAFTIFDDFNVDEGHFTSDPNTSATSVDDAANSVADRVVTPGADGLSKEGVGFQKLVLNYEDNNAAIAGIRIRHLSGGGTVGNNISFTTTGGTDGFIGYYVRTNVSGLTTSINLDGASGVTAAMDGSTAVNLIADDAWHLYEWDLDSVTDWGVIPGIGGGHGGALLNESHTIDSIYFRDVNGLPSPSGTYYLDFVARNDSGSVDRFFDEVAVPEPGSFATMGLVGLIATGLGWLGKNNGFMSHFAF